MVSSLIVKVKKCVISLSQCNSSRLLRQQEKNKKGNAIIFSQESSKIERTNFFSPLSRPSAPKWLMMIRTAWVRWQEGVRGSGDPYALHWLALCHFSRGTDITLVYTDWHYDFFFFFFSEGRKGTRIHLVNTNWHFMMNYQRQMIVSEERGREKKRPQRP